MNDESTWSDERKAYERYMRAQFPRGRRATALPLLSMIGLLGPNVQRIAVGRQFGMTIVKSSFGPR